MTARDASAAAARADNLLTIPQIRALVAWKVLHGQTFARDVHRPKRLYEVIHPDRVPCIEMIDRRGYGHWLWWRDRVAKGWEL